MFFKGVTAFPFAFCTLCNFNSLTSSLQAALYDTNLLNLATNCCLMYADCTMRTQIELQPTTYVNQRQCAGIKCYQPLL